MVAPGHYTSMLMPVIGTTPTTKTRPLLFSRLCAMRKYVQLVCAIKLNCHSYKIDGDSGRLKSPALEIVPISDVPSGLRIARPSRAVYPLACNRTYMRRTLQSMLKEA